MRNYWGIEVVSGVMNILGALGILFGVYICTAGAFGVAFGLGSITGGIVLIANAQLLTLAVGLARNVALIAENTTREA